MNSYLNIYATDFFSIVLGAMIVICNYSYFRKKQEKVFYLLLMLVFSFLSIVFSTIAFRHETNKGLQLLVEISMAGCYTSNAFIAISWAFFLENHLNGRATILKRWILTFPLLAVIIMLIINIFFPFIYEIKDGKYIRMFGYFIISAVDAFYLIYSLVIYFYSLKRSGFMKFFPVYVFFIPVVLGYIFQTLIMGLVLEVPCILIGLTGVVFSLKNEIIYTDELTGLFNRSYLDHQKTKITENAVYYGIMFDLNNFKSINDKFGHKEGDEALKRAAILLKQGIGNKGVVIRYAGDEFIAFFKNTTKEQVDSSLSLISRLFNDENRIHGKDYELTISYGADKFNQKEESIDDFIKRIDNRMYQNKENYYSEHKEIARRK